MLCVIAVDAPASEPADVFPATSLPWTLVGVFAHSSPKQAGAIITVGEEEQKYVKADDAIADNVILHSIESSSVVLIHNGTYERLYFARARRTLPVGSHYRADPGRQESQGEALADPQHLERADTNKETRKKMNSMIKRYLQSQESNNESS
jgi:type II secretory pathway component PulC